jgi:hypothetical protein
MGRGARLAALIAAAFALAGPAPQHGAQPDQAATKQTKPDAPQAVAATPEPIKPVEPPEYYQPCGNDRQDSNSDLCAQWTAAKGAADAAYWAKWSFWISFIGIFGLLGTLYYTRKAVLAAEEGMRDADSALEIADRNAKAAADQVKVSEDTAHRQLRPYVYLTDCKITYHHMHSFEIIGDTADIVLHFKNFGHTPAKNVTLRAKAFVGGIWNEKFRANFRDIRDVALGDMPPGFEKDQPGYTLLGLKAAHQFVQNGTQSVFVEGLLKYEDGAGNKFKTQFRLASTGDDYFAERFQVAPFETYAT